MPHLLAFADICSAPDTVVLQKSWIDSNTGGSHSGWYMQDLKLTMKEVTISNGIGPAHQFFRLGNYGLDLDYVTWYNNAYPTASQSLAAAGTFSPNPPAPQGGATWTIKHSTVFNNTGQFASAFTFASSSVITISNTAFEVPYLR